MREVPRMTVLLHGKHVTAVDMFLANFVFGVTAHQTGVGGWRCSACAMASPWRIAICMVNGYPAVNWLTANGR